MKLTVLSEAVARKPITSTGQMLISYIDPEEDWEDAAEVEQISKRVGIHFSRHKDVHVIAKVGMNVVGGIAAVVYPDDEYPAERVLDFDVVVDPQWQGYQGVGLKLVKFGEDLARDWGAGKISTIVVNPRLARYMVDKLGYCGDLPSKPTTVRLEKYI